MARRKKQGSELPPRMVMIWRSYRVSALAEEIAERGGVLHVEAVWPDYRMEIWPPPALEAQGEGPAEGTPFSFVPEPMEDRPEPPKPQLEPRLEHDPVKAEEVTAKMRASTEQTNSDILRMWRERGL